MNEFVRQNYGCLKIGLGAGCRYFISKTMWKDFFKDYPLISYDVEEYTYRQSIELLNNKELDILIISDYTPGKEYYQYELKTQERVLLLPKEHPALQEEYAELQDLKEESFVLSINDLAYHDFTEFCKIITVFPKRSCVSAIHSICMKPAAGIAAQELQSRDILPMYSSPNSRTSI